MDHMRTLVNFAVAVIVAVLVQKGQYGLAAGVFSFMLFLNLED